MRDVCKHCQVEKYIEARGLCRGCYSLMEIRHLHPCLSSYHHYATRDLCGGYQLPETPTPHAPGSTEKIDVLAARAKRHEALFHPLDAKHNFE